jgi:hypothetical protein
VAVLEIMVTTGRTAEAIADPERTGDLRTPGHRTPPVLEV